MLAIGIRYLCGWAAATNVASWSEPEWPPHPDRVFMALAAAHFETDGGPNERAMLEWLERAPSPAMSCSSHSARTSVTAYVPVNDVAVPRLRRGAASSAQVADAEHMLPDRRPRKPRTFQRAVPIDPVVALMWPDDPPDRHTLEGLCRKVTRVGHSSSLVQMWVVDEPPLPNLVPIPDGGQRLRVPAAGRLQELERLYHLEQRPRPARWQAYGLSISEHKTTAAKSSCSRDILVLRRTGGTPIGLASTLVLTQALRRTLLAKLAAQSVPEWISGHRPDGTPSAATHLGWMPLPYIGHEHADGHLLGVGVVVPEAIEHFEAIRALRPFLPLTDGGSVRVYDGRVLDVTFEIDLDPLPHALRPETWTAAAASAGATTWATVTPIVLPRYPKKDGDVERLIGLACEQAGLPPPAAVVAGPVSRWRGVPHAREFAEMVSHGSGARAFHTHAVIAFSRPLVGPVLVGAGRYRGYGLCRPWSGEEA